MRSLNTRVTLATRNPLASGAWAESPMTVEPVPVAVTSAAAATLPLMAAATVSRIGVGSRLQRWYRA
jgi:hypothetical protein